MHESSPVRIFYVPAAKPGRTYKLTLQGLQAHPRVELVDDPDDSDLVFYHFQAWDTAHRFPAEKLVFVDFHDNPYLMYPVSCLAYFKRSWAHPVTSGPRYAMAAADDRPAHVHPTAYAVMDEFVVPETLERDIDIACLLRPNQTKRARILEILHGYDFGAHTAQIGPVNDAGRGSFDRAYLNTLRRSRIVITANPDDWEGDSRLWEALANGALVFVDPMHTPIEHPLVDGVHCVFYDSSGIDQEPTRLRPLLDRIDHFLAHPNEADAIARRGREHAITHHRAVHRIDAMLRTVDDVLAGTGELEPSPKAPVTTLARPHGGVSQAASRGLLTVTGPTAAEPVATNGSSVATATAPARLQAVSRRPGTDVERFLDDFNYVFPPHTIGEVNADLEDRATRRLYDPCFDIEGMTSVKKQVLLQLAAKHVGADECYFEVGTYTGKSLVSAMLGAPDTRFYACDNFSLFKDTNSYEILMRNLGNHGLADRVTFYDDDFRNVVVPERIREPIGVYFYDGKHNLESQCEGIQLVEPLLADRAIVIVDDWRFAEDSPSYAREGTELAISRSDREWRKLLELPARYNGDHATWWNGVAVFETTSR